MPFCLAEWHHFSILEDGHSRNTPVKLFQNPLTDLGGEILHDSLHPFYSIFFSGGHFVKLK